MADKIMLKDKIKNSTLVIKNQKNTYSSQDLTDLIEKWKEKLGKIDLKNKLVGLCSNDSVFQFVLSVVLWDGSSSIMYLNPNNGNEYIERIVEGYYPHYLIFEGDFYDKNVGVNWVGKKIHDFTDDNVVVCALENGNKLMESRQGCIFFSSGTTAVPKAVLRSEKNIKNDALSNIYSFNICAEDKVLITVPFGHVYGLGSGVVPFALQGATIYFIPSFMSAKKIKRVIEEEKITALISTPLIYEELLVADTDLTTCRLMLSAGSKPNNKLIRRFYDRYKVNINNMYGSSETGAIATLYGDAMKEVDNTNCGRPMELIQVYCDGTAVQDGIIRVKSDSIADGILKDGYIEELVGADGWFEMNDMGFIDEKGCIHLRCRKDDMINIGGEKLSTQTIEKIVEQYYEQSIVLIETKEDGTSYPVLYIADSGIDLDLLADKLKERLSYKFIPRKVYIYDEFPRNSNGKIDRNRLREGNDRRKEYNCKNFKYIHS